MRILKDSAIGLVIDMQERLFPHIANYYQINQNVKILIEGLKILKIPLLVTQQYTKGLGETIPEIREVLGDFEIHEKNSFSCCDNSKFSVDLENKVKKFIIICGIEAHVCVQQTVIDLIDRAYYPIVVADCISSRSIENKKIAIKHMRQLGAFITTYESLLFELCRYSNVPEFKLISKLVK